LAFEGSESLAQRLGLMKEHSEPHDHSIPGTEDLKAAEDATVSSAVKTDTVLSIEIIAITVASVVNEPITTQVGVLILISIIATFAVYGVVGIIIKMDDIGFYIKQTHTNSAALNLLSKLLIQGMPVVLKMLGTIGMVAMLMVGGGILIHNLSFLHGLVDFGSTLPSILPHVVQLFASPVAISLTVGASILVVKGLVSRAKVA
jgi:hypothetical protein